MPRTIHNSVELAIHNIYNSLLILSALGINQEGLELLRAYHTRLMEDASEEDDKMAAILEKVMEL